VQRLIDIGERRLFGVLRLLWRPDYWPYRLVPCRATYELQHQLAYRSLDADQ
jgi:hypothetical protein